MKGLLISSDVEVGAYPSESTEEVREIIPPAYFIHVLGATPQEYLNGNERKPVLVKDDAEKIQWFQDGALFEVAYSPASTPGALYGQVKKSVEILENWLREYEHSVLFAPVGMFNLSRYGNIPAISEACIAGCNPDKNALIEGYRPRVVSLEDWGYRGMGGHIHMSLPKEVWGDALHRHERTILRLLTIFAGNVTVLTNTRPDLELLRLERFGHPGSYRTPTYPGDVCGFEYRAPSSSWLNSEEVVELVFKAVDVALELALTQADASREIITAFLNNSVKAILEQDKLLAEEVLETLGLL